jgi:hypothetical protein
MPQYRDGASESDYLRLRASMLELGANGAFDANDALVYSVSRGLTSNAGDVAAMLGDLRDLGELEATGRTEGIAQRFQLPRQP